MCAKHHRKPTSYYPIYPKTNDGTSYNPIYVKGTSGYIDLITPTTFGTSTIVWDYKAQIISGESLEMILSAHHRLMGTIDVPCPPLQLAPQARQIIVQIGESILHASRTEVLNKQDTERMVQEIINACDVLPPSPGPSSTSASSGTPEKAVSASTSSVTCNEKYLTVRKPEDDQDGEDGGDGGDGPSGSPKGSRRNRKSGSRGSQQTKSTENRSTSASSSKPQDAVESLEASECSGYGSKEWSWELVESDQEQVETAEEFGELEWTWELLDSESEIDDSDISEESGSGLSSPITGGPADITGWLQSLHDITTPKLTEPSLGAALPITSMVEVLADRRQGER